MTIYITNTAGWTDCDGRIAKPNFKQERLIWRGKGEDVCLVGFEKANRQAGKAGVDYVDWSNPPKWATAALDEQGLSLSHDTDDSDEEALEVPTEPVADDVEGQD